MRLQKKNEMKGKKKEEEEIIIITIAQSEKHNVSVERNKESEKELVCNGVLCELSMYETF